MSTDGGLRKTFRSRLPMVHWTTIETGIVERGVPDMHGTWKGSSFWIENKRARGLEISLRPAQIGWLLRNARNGGRAFVAVRKKDVLWIFHGRDARMLARDGLRCGRVAGQWPGGAAGWPWPVILRLLATG
jgi:hypothetical protein